MILFVTILVCHRNKNVLQKTIKFNIHNSRSIHCCDPEVVTDHNDGTFRRTAVLQLIVYLKYSEVLTLTLHEVPQKTLFDVLNSGFEFFSSIQ